jgi:rhodanese-related sulfurtransferase
MSDIRIIGTRELQERLNRGGDFVFWNVLTDEYFHGEMIPGSERVPLDRIGREVRARRLTLDREILVYCAGPSCPQSRLAAEKLQNLGYRQVFAYEGGLQEWKEAGLPLDQIAA